MAKFNKKGYAHDRQKDRQQERLCKREAYLNKYLSGMPIRIRICPAPCKRGHNGTLGAESANDNHNSCAKQYVSVMDLTNALYTPIWIKVIIIQLFMVINRIKAQINAK